MSAEKASTLDEVTAFRLPPKEAWDLAGFALWAQSVRLDSWSVMHDFLVSIKTEDGIEHAGPGTWIVLHDDGIFYLYDDAEFSKLYRARPIEA